MYYYITNLQGDVTQLVNSNGTAVATYEYDPYDNIISATGSLTETSPCATVDMYMTVTKTPIDSDAHPRSYKFRVGTE